MGELELYPRTNWARAIAIGLASMLLLGYSGYRWVTTSTPVDRDAAVALFRAGIEGSHDGTISETTDPATATSSARSRSGPPEKDAGRGKTSVATKRATAAPAAGQTAPTPARGQRANRSQLPERPDEGVYSWDTDGWEQAAGIRREMPKESQRILTHNSDGSYKNHHYFSEEREIWTQFRFFKRGAELMWQRNKVKFGPVTNDSRIIFSPPMVVGTDNMQVGQRWADTWSGDTSGDYKSHVFEHVTMRIGDENVEVWGIEYEINLRGEQRGRVDAQVWFAPEYSLTVQEHYIQDVETDAGKYHAEWKMTLQSVHPET
jgi:hypothetical protein